MAWAQAQNQNQKYRVQMPAATGLNNAMMQVRNQVQQQLLEQVATQIQAKWQEKLQRMTNVEFSEEEDTGRVEVKAEQQARFLWIFKMKKTNKYYVNEDTGELYYRKSWADFLWSGYEV